MEKPYNLHLFLSDALLTFHVIFVLFIVIGFILIWIGYFLKWSFIRNFYFRLIHLFCMGIVASESVVGVFCPLTLWEDQLRSLGGGGPSYHGTFMQHFFHKLLFLDFPLEVFNYVYVTFFVVLTLSFVIVRPHWPKWRKIN